MAVVTATLSETLKVASIDALVTAKTVTMADLVIVTPRAARTWRLTAVLASTLRIASVPASGSIIVAVLRAALGISSGTRVGHGVVLRSAFKAAHTAVVQRGIAMAERVGVRPRVGASGRYERTRVDTVEVSSTLPRPNLGGLLRAVVGIASHAVNIYRAVAHASDHLEIYDVLAQKLTITVVSREVVLVRDDTLLGAIYAGTLSDAVDFIIDTVNSSGDTTTWAMNVRTGAVTEYLNYSFNSFAQSANGTYLGAGDDGLFELVGSDDAGTPVIADIISGLVDFSGSFLSGMQAAYLAVRGGGEFFLKLTEATGRSVTYQVKVTSLRTARVNVGKGLRARYFTYELVSTGQDFDLLDLTFLPIQQTRRI